MPNWCNNVLYLKHKDRKMIERAETALSEDRFFTEFDPLEPNESAVDIWGTKWDEKTNMVEIENMNDNSVQILSFFDTAWNPPIKFYEKLVNDFDFDVKAYFYEPGQQFYGRFSNDNGFDIFEYSS